MMLVCFCFPQDKQTKGDRTSRESYVAPFRKPLTQLTNPPLCVDSNQHVRIGVSLSRPSVQVSDG